MVDENGKIRVTPVAILDRRMMKMGNKAATMVLVQWSNLFEEDSTWENLDELRKELLEFNDNS